MRRKKYVEAAKTAILNRVRFHAPIVYDDNIDWKGLSANGIDGTIPLFKFDKNLSRPLLRAFTAALKEESFSLIISHNSLGKIDEKRLKKCDKIKVYSPENSTKSFIETINKLNINYSSASNYNLVFKERFFKVNGQPLNPHFEDYFLKQQSVFDEIKVDFCEFVLNGNNFFVALKNEGEQAKKVELELNIPLAKGYFYFKRLNKAICVENLLTKEKFYLNYLCRNAKFSFSNVDGLENSVFCCVNVKVNVFLQAHEENFVFFNFGDGKFVPKSRKEIEMLKNLSHKKVCEIFNVQVKTKEPKFDFLFNKTLPQKIWTNWINGQQDLRAEYKYVAYRRLFLKGCLQSLDKTDFKRKNKGISLVCFKEIGLKELGIFNGSYYKKICVVSGNEKFFRVGQTMFYNSNGITEISLKSKEPLSVCFGET